MSVSYEAFAPRSLSQRNRLSRLEELLGNPYYGDEEDEEGEVKEEEEKDVMGWVLDSMSSTTTTSSGNESDKWRRVAEKEAESLSGLVESQISVKHCLTEVCRLSREILERHSELLQQSGELSLAAERLQAEEICLQNKAEALGEPLLHYDAMDRISHQLGVEFAGHGSKKIFYRDHLSFDPDDYLPTLTSLQQAIPYFTSTQPDPDYRDRALLLRDYTLEKLKEGIVPRIQQISTTELPSHNNNPNAVITADKLEASVLYTRFAGISSRCQSLLQVLSHFFSTNDHDDEEDNVYQELWNVCRNTYCTCRKKLLLPIIQKHLDKLREEHGLVGMTRLASVFLLRICTLETNLYLDFFGTSDKDQKKHPPPVQLLTADGKDYKDKEFQFYLDALCYTLYKTVRRGLVSLLDLDTLCQVVTVLREERTLANASPITMAAARAISHCTRDAQERLIFCANTTLTQHVYKYKPTPQDLDYPAILSKPHDTIYDAWFPPIRIILKVLSKIFRVVEPRVFDDIALSSIQACVSQLQQSAHTIHHTKLQQNKANTTGAQLHADLFLIQHLLLLREQLSPFDMTITSVQRQLDFRDAGKAVTKFLANRNRQLFQLHQDNALLTLLREGMSIKESSVDGRKDLEEALKSACHDFMDHTSRTLAQPLFLLLDQYKTSSLPDDPSNIQAIVQQVQDRLEPTLGDLLTQMKLYMDNPATRQILYRPVLRKVTRVLKELQRQPNFPSSSILQQIEQTLNEASTTLTTTTTDE